MILFIAIGLIILAVCAILFLFVAWILRVLNWSWLKKPYIYPADVLEEGMSSNLRISYEPAKAVLHATTEKKYKPFGLPPEGSDEKHSSERRSVRPFPGRSTCTAE